MTYPTLPMSQYHLCFVCLGNICRSPTAEGVFKHLARQAGRGAEFHVESAGLGGWHVGDAPDPRTQRTALAHGVPLTSRAQQFRARDFARFDLILAADAEVLDGLQALAPDQAAGRKLRRLREFDPQARGDLDVPDPYYGSAESFELVYQMIERACRKLLDELAPAE